MTVGIEVQNLSPPLNQEVSPNYLHLRSVTKHRHCAEKRFYLFKWTSFNQFLERKKNNNLVWKDVMLRSFIFRQTRKPAPLNYSEKCKKRKSWILESVVCKYWLLMKWTVFHNLRKTGNVRRREIVGWWRIFLVNSKIIFRQMLENCELFWKRLHLLFHIFITFVFQVSNLYFCSRGQNCMLLDTI